jgi:fibronectin-binding autotransporter adhesin
VAVASGATLGGVGSVGGAVTVSGTIAPGGGGVGTLSTAGETWNGGGACQFGLNNATNSSGWDLVNISGALNIQSATNNLFTIKLVSLTSSNTPGPIAGFTSAGTNVWTVALASGGIQNFNPAKFAVDTTSFSNAFNGSFSVSTNGGSLLLSYSGSSLTSPTMTNAQLSANGVFSFASAGPSGQSYRVLTCTNPALALSNWLVATSGVFGSTAVIYSEPATNPQKFYRVASP